MKKKVKTILKKSASNDREAILSALIKRTLDRYSIEEITEAFLNHITTWQDRVDLVNTLLEDENTKEEIKEKLEDEFKEEITAGKFIVKLETQEQETKLTDFICTHIFPYVNQQQSFLLFN